MKKYPLLPVLPRIKVRTVYVRPAIRTQDGKVQLVKPYLRSKPQR